MRAAAKLLLSRDGFEISILYGDLHAAAVKTVVAKTHSYRICKKGDAGAHCVPRGKIVAVGGAVADRFDGFRFIPTAHRGVFLTRCVFVKLQPQFAEKFFQRFCGEGSQFTDGIDTVSVQNLGGSAAYKKKIADGKGIDDLFPVFAGNKGGSIGLFVVAAQFGKDFVERNTHRKSEAQFSAYPVSDLICHLDGISAEKMAAARNIQPAFVNAKGLHKVGILGVDGVDFLGVNMVEVVVGRKKHQIGALLFGLPDGFCRGYAALFGELVFGKDNAVAGGGVAADGHGNILQIGAGKKFYGGIETVEVTVKHDAIHGKNSFPSFASVYHRQAGKERACGILRFTIKGRCFIIKL